MSYFSRVEAAPSLDCLLMQKEEEIANIWLLLQNEAECDVEDADIGKMGRLLMYLKKLISDKDDLCEAIDRRDAVR